MFIFKEGSRNAMNESRMEGVFKKNYRKIFKMELPHLDTINNVLKALDEAELKKLKQGLVSTLFNKKVLHKWRFMGQYFKIAVDGTGVYNFKECHCDKCLIRNYKSFELTENNYQALYNELGEAVTPIRPVLGKTFKKESSVLSSLKDCLDECYIQKHKDELLKSFAASGTTRYFHQVLEAKIICENGFSVSIGTEWIENSNEEYDKQDCESSAFKRLAKIIKKEYPRLPICIVADGLYPNEPFFNICTENNWEFICAFKDGSLPTLRKEIIELASCENDNKINYTTIEGNTKKVRHIAWVEKTSYKNTPVSWVQCIEKQYDLEGELLKEIKFEYLSSKPVNKQNAKEVVATGRLRQKIENEGFNTQKNLGYNLKHKYSRISLNASKNYYQCMQIAHLINQLFELSREMKDKLTQWKSSLKHCWTALIGFMYYGDIDEQDLEYVCKTPTQYQYPI